MLGRRNDMYRYVSLCAALLAGAAACGGNDNGSPTEPSLGPCTYALSASTLSFGEAGGSQTVTVTAPGHCTWTATSDSGWITVDSGASGSGNGTVRVTVTPNTGAAERSGTLTIAGQSVGVREQGLAACAADISPAAASFGKDSATGTFAVTAAGHCEWSAASDAGWLAVTAGSPGRGNGTVAYAVERNREINARTATIRVAERTFTVTQAGDPPLLACDYSVAPVLFTPCMAGATLTATVRAQSGCTWTAESDVSWITVTQGRTGDGTETITFRVSDNWDAPRQSVVKVRWPTPSAGQNLQVQQAGCRYAVSTSAISIGAPGGTSQFNVVQQSEPYTCGGPTQDACMWTAVSDVPWMTVTTSMPQFGDDPVSFTVAPNSSTTARTGTIRVRDQVVRITQAGL